MTTTLNLNDSGRAKLALSRTETDKALGVSTITVYRLVKRGLLRPSRATRRLLFPIWEIERFLCETSLEIKL
jgi:hypothetical protein